jgi:hypothetical protein
MAHVKKSLIWSVEQVNKMEEICKKIFLSLPNNNETLLFAMSSRQKYTDVNMGSAKRDSFFNRTLWPTAMQNNNTLLQILEQTQNIDFEKQIPESLSMYMVLNPRSQTKALHNLYHGIMSHFINGTQSNHKPDFTSALKSEIHAYENAIKMFVEIDCDTKDVELIKKFATLANFDIIGKSYFIIETRGGYHFVYQRENFNPGKELHATTKLAEFCYSDISRDGKILPKQQYFTIRSDVCFPVPGTLQAGSYQVSFASSESFN